ncbi:hypothetical protein [Vagococcus zengguangii]|uniref:Uncharacterized protein n=1 Tax=Vagococcus zengguangii TaxID=2571750 RepID=A0A4D7CSF1_9ENTE|nr:hypothetical protein [Vagococcus zengguangii]QCI87205.1 hypothetical protein FA707_09810 [Vagococcus zengguangii]TLG80709.1 hypothetical protein FE258_04425 [Vagococcus zengguangii]
MEKSVKLYAINELIKQGIKVVKVAYLAVCIINYLGELVMSDFVTDRFFGKKHYKLKIYQSLLSLSMWFLVVAPVVITLNSIYFKVKPLTFIQWKYREGFKMYHTVVDFLLVALVVFLVVGLLLTLRNNYMIKNYYKKQVTYDEKRVAGKAALLEEVYTERFGSVQERQAVKYYSISEEKNFDASFVSDLYQDGGF